MIRNFQELYQYRALLLALVQRELQSRYRGSVLGFLWTFLNPTLLMLVYALVFSVYMRSDVPAYTYFMFVGLLPWLCFAACLTSGTSSISDRRDLLTKVRFPAQVLPATAVAVQVANFVLSVPLMLGLGLMQGHVPTWHVLLAPLVLAVQLTFTLGLVYLLSAINVAFRDLQHVVGNLVTLWFFVTPVLYPVSTVPEQFRGWVVLANPMAGIILAYQALFYGHALPDFAPLAVVFVGSLGLLSLSTRVFESRRELFAEIV